MDYVEQYLEKLITSIKAPMKPTPMERI